MTLHNQLSAYTPFNEQEARDLARMLDFLRTGKTPFDRANDIAHFTASAWVVNPGGEKVLLAFHNIYASWAWTGGHADGECDLRAAARREAQEETGLYALRDLGDGPLSIEILPVFGHEKRACYVSSHLHYNVTYLFEADEDAPLRTRPGENRDVGWFTPERALEIVSEPWMKARIYPKLIAKTAALYAGLNG